MSWFTRFTGLTGRERIDRDLQDEIQSHLAMAARDRIADGADDQAAELEALKEFGNITLTREAARQVWSPRWLEAVRDLLSDVRYAVRVLRKNPGFSSIVIAVLALGIGLNAGVFTLYKSLAVEPLAGVRDSGRLAVILTKTTAGNADGVSYPDYKYFRDHDRAFDGLSGSAMSMVNVGLGNRGERVIGEFVTGNYFEVLGVSAQLGRTLLPSDEIAQGRHPVVVLGDGLWRRTFGADPGIVGKTIHLNAQPLTVVGVADPTFHGTIVSFDIELFIPLMMAPQLGLTFEAVLSGSPDVLTDPAAHLLMVLGHPRPGVALATASAQTDVIARQLAADRPIDEVSQRLAVLPIWESPFGAQTYMLPAMSVVGVTGGLLLLIVCANIAGLVLVRGVSRRGEIAVRLALGASRARVLRLLLIENFVLAVPGALLGLAIVSNALPVLWSGAAEAAPGRMYLNLAVDRFVIGFAVAVSCASALFFGFIPALRSSRVDLMSVMKDDASPRGAARGRFRAGLVVAQVAISLLLLVGAGLVARSLDAARRANPGFDADNVTSVTVDVRPNGYDATRGRAFFQDLLDRVRADEGVESASLAAIYPMTMVEFPGQKMAVDGYAPRKGEDLVFLSNTIAPDYFRTLRIGMVAGRDFSRLDDPSAQPVVIVNDTLARRFWGSPTNAIGKRIQTLSGEWRSIVGVAQDVKYARIDERPRPYVYLPFLQTYQSSMILHSRGVAGAAGSPSTTTLISQARQHITDLDAELPILDAKSLTSQTTAALGIFALTAVALLTFGVAAMGLAAMGTYGLVSYSVKQSTHEIGVRMALGAPRASLVWRFLSRGLRLGVLGAALGVVASLAVTRLLGSVLYGVSAIDLVSFGTASLVVLASVLVATLIPAWRASRTSPLTALRHQ